MTLTTQSAIRQEYCLQTGGFVETATAQTTTTITSSAMIGQGGAGDDASLKNWTLYEGTDAVADAQRIITAWDDSAGKATFDTINARAGTEVHEYYPKGDPGGVAVNHAINTMLRNTHRAVESVIPTYKGQREYAFLNAPWIETISDVLDSFQRNSPNLIDNGGFESWGIGSSAGLHAWTLSGTSATVTRVDGTYGRFAARLTSTGGNGAVLTQTIPIPIQQLYSEVIKFSVRVKTSTAAMATVDVTDGTDTTQSTAHAGGGAWTTLTVSHTVNAAAAGPLQFKLTLDATNGNADFETAVSAKDDIPEWLSDFGNQHATTVDLRGDVQVSSTGAVLRLPRLGSLGSQIAIVSKQPFFELSANTGAGGITDIPIDAAVSGLIVEIAKRQINKANAAKWITLLGVHEKRYANWQKRLARKPVRGITTRVVIGPA